jgi:hypothetical protein
MEAIYELLLGSRDKPFLVGIFDAQNELTSGLASKQVIIKGSAPTSEMGVPSWRRCKPYTGGGRSMTH